MIQLKRPFILSAFTLMFSYIALMLKAEILLFSVLTVFGIVFIITAIKGMVIAKPILLFTALIVLASILFELFSFYYENDSKLTGFDQKITGTVTEISYDEYGDLHCIVLSDCTVDGTKIHSKIAVYPNSTVKLSYCDKISFTATETFTSENTGIFRYHSLSKKTVLSCFCNNTFELNEKADKNIYSIIMNLRDKFSEKLNESLDSENSAVAEALITGNSDMLSQKSAVNFRICGISHIFAVSGMHLSVWTSFFFIIFKQRSRSAYIPNMAASVFVVVYIVFTGFSPSVLRAGIMLLSVFTARMIKRAADPLNSLGLAGTVILLVNPFIAGNVSFLLSFTATAAIIIWNGYIFKKQTIYNGRTGFIANKLKSLVNDIAVSVAVMLTTIPIVSLFFGYISLISPFISLIVTPLAEAVMVLSFFVILIPSGNFVSDILCDLTNENCSNILNITARASEIDSAVLPVNSNIVLPCFTVTLLVCIYFIIFKGDRKRAFTSIITGTLIFALLTSGESYIRKDEASIFIAGGTNSTMIAITASCGDCSLIYGAGGTYSQLADTAEYLSSKGILKTDMLFIPRNTKTENGNYKNITERLLPTNTVYGFFSQEADTYTCEIWEDAYIHSKTTNDFAASVIMTGSIKTVICTLPGSDFYDCDEIFTSGDILICRNSIPKSVNRENFTDIIIMTDKDAEYTDPYISTKNGNIEVIIKGDSYAINR